MNEQARTELAAQMLATFREVRPIRSVSISADGTVRAKGSTRSLRNLAFDWALSQAFGRIWWDGESLCGLPKQVAA